MHTRELVATITAPVAMSRDDMESLKVEYENEGYRDVRLMRVVTTPGNSVVYDVSAARSSNPYRKVT